MISYAAASFFAFLAFCIGWVICAIMGGDGDE